MKPVSSIAAHLERQSVLSVESTIPEGMTIQEWRRRGRPAKRRYEPSFTPHEAAGATIHQLPVRPREQQPLRRAA
jgi:hypothetical protein